MSRSRHTWYLPTVSKRFKVEHQISALLWQSLISFHSGNALKMTLGVPVPLHVKWELTLNWQPKKIKLHLWSLHKLSAGERETLCAWTLIDEAEIFGMKNLSLTNFGVGGKTKGPL